MKIDLNKIRQQNALSELETPFNHCDRWCERCLPDTQGRCRLFQDELEQKITAAAHGRDEDDPEVLSQVLNWQYGHLNQMLQEAEDEDGDDMGEDFGAGIRDNADEETGFSGTEGNDLKSEIQTVSEDPLSQTAFTYSTRARDFLKNIFPANSVRGVLHAERESLVWYHSMIPVKIMRMIGSWREADGGQHEHALCDAVAQLDISRKSVRLSLAALERISVGIKEDAGRKAASELLAILRNLDSRLDLFEAGI